MTTKKKHTEKKEVKKFPIGQSLQPRKVGEPERFKEDLKDWPEQPLNYKNPGAPDDDGGETINQIPQP